MVVLAVVCFAEETTDLLQTAVFHRKLLSKGNEGGVVFRFCSEETFNVDLETFLIVAQKRPDVNEEPGGEN